MIKYIDNRLDNTLPNLEEIPLPNLEVIPLPNLEEISLPNLEEIPSSYSSAMIFHH